MKEKWNGSQNGSGVMTGAEIVMGTKKKRYSDDELQEFKTLLKGMLKKAEEDFQAYKIAMNNSDGNGTEDTSPTFKVLEEGAATLSKEEAGKLAIRQQKFIQTLKAALVRCENKTYGICKETGKLISKERLRAVPGATTCAEVKRDNSQPPRFYMNVRPD